VHTKGPKRRGRKVIGFFSILLLIPLLAYLKTDFSWPLVVLLLGMYLTFAGLISAEDVLMAWIQSKSRSKGGESDAK
jgi:hypothetical protein